MSFLARKKPDLVDVTLRALRGAIESAVADLARWADRASARQAIGDVLGPSATRNPFLSPKSKGHTQ
jgi:hypothetical protein